MLNNTAEKNVMQQNEYHIASFVAHAISSQMDEVVQAITATTGSEIHAVTPEMKIVFTIEADSQQAIGKLIDKLKYHPGLMSLSPVYHQYINQTHNSNSEKR